MGPCRHADELVRVPLLVRASSLDILEAVAVAETAVPACVSAAQTTAEGLEVVRTVLNAMAERPELGVVAVVGPVEVVASMAVL